MTVFLCIFAHEFFNMDNFKNFSVERFETSTLGSNCYAVFPKLNEASAIIIDAGGDYARINEYLTERGKRAVALLLTHGHFDHAMAAAEFQRNGAPVYISETDGFLIKNGGDLARYFGTHLPPFNADNWLIGGVLQIAGLEIDVIETPGHTAGGLCFKIDEALFTGDVLFKGGFGRTDFPSGKASELVSSIKKLFALEGELAVYPGHGESTTLSSERENNPIKNLKAW